VFVAPSKIKNSFLFCFRIVVPITAACPLPIPGRKLQRGAARREDIIGFNLNFGFVIFCFGILTLFFML
jgi:hypothetical protein